MALTAGVIAVQGDVAEHAEAIRAAARQHGERAEVVEIRQSGLVPDCDVLLLPGGESTTISGLLHQEDIAPEIRDHVDEGRPLLATCAGLIVVSRDPGDDRVTELGLVDAAVDRNAFGRQADSFETDLDVDGLDESVHAVFIRAPVVREVGDTDVLASFDGHAVAIRDGPVLGTSFHPELTEDYGIHRLAFFDRNEN